MATRKSKKFNYEAGYRQLRKDYKKVLDALELIQRDNEVTKALCESARYAKEVAIFHRHDEEGRVILP